MQHRPARFGVWLSKLNHTYRVAQAASTLVVHLLRDGDGDLAERFGGETGDEVDKFAGIDWQPGPDGCPVIQRLDWFAGSIVDRVDTGDHVAFVLARVGRCVRPRARWPAPRSATSSPAIRSRDAEPRCTSTSCSTRSGAVDRPADAAMVAVDSGFAGIWTYDHVDGHVYGATEVLECWTVLSALAVVVPEAVLGPRS